MVYLDLDSISSSLALAWYLSESRKTRDVIALLQTARGDLKLRPENLLAFDFAGIDQDALLCVDDIPESTPFPSSNFALVDHNSLLPEYSDNNVDAHVFSIIDHHEDQQKHLDAEPRIIVTPTQAGSASSLVTEYIRKSGSEIPEAICTLLLSAILIDTAGLKPNGKAVAVDHAAASYLVSRSPTHVLGAASLRQDGLSLAVFPLTQQLLTSKFNISDLGTPELLRRDYKQYRWTLSPEGRTIVVGLSTVPVDLRIWLSRGSLQDDFWAPVDEFMDKRGLDILGILTTFNDVKKGSKSKSGPGASGAEKGKHKRQLLFVVRDGDLAQRLWDGIQESDELDVEERLIRKYATKHRTKEGKHAVGEDGGVAGRIARAYKQGNAHATRKVVAPVLQRIFEGKNAQL